MTTNDETRAALVLELREAVRPELRFAVKCNGKLDDARDEAIAHMIADDNLPGVIGSIMPIIDRLLADRAVPEPDADAVERAAKAMCEYELSNASCFSLSWDTIPKNYGKEGIPGQARYRDMARAALSTVSTVQAAVPEPGAIERAAKAIHLTRSKRTFSEMPWWKMHKNWHEGYREDARAALQAATVSTVQAAVPEPDADAIERAAKAIAEMYPPRDNKHDGYVKPVWDMADIEDLAEHVLLTALIGPRPQGEEAEHG